MATTKEERKEKALEILHQLDIHKPYINGFKHDDKVCFFENYAGYWVNQETELTNKLKEIEDKYNCTVYAVTHEYTDFGECYDFLIITDYKEEWPDIVGKYQGNEFFAFAYVWNKDDDSCSEFGSIVVKSFGGGIKRVL